MHAIADWAKKEKKSGTYDCICGVNGGKDTTFTALYARDKLGLNCLFVNAYREKITEVGRYNLDNLSNLGFDMISLRSRP